MACGTVAGKVTCSPRLKLGASLNTGMDRSYLLLHVFLSFDFSVADGFATKPPARTCKRYRAAGNSLFLRRLGAM